MLRIFKTVANKISVALLLEILTENMCSKRSPVLVGDQLPEDLCFFPSASLELI